MLNYLFFCFFKWRFVYFQNLKVGSSLTIWWCGDTFRLVKGKRGSILEVTFHSSVQIIKPYSSSFANYTAVRTKEPCVDGSVNNLKFCPQRGCTESFTDKVSLAEHMLLGRHTSQPVSKTMMDKARLTYVNKMKCSNLNSTHHQLPSNSINSKTEGLENFTKISGWALPKRRVFHYSTKQKRLLMEIFLAGEECRKKMIPEQVHHQLHTKLKPSEYATSQPIRSLFSRQVSFYNQSVFLGLWSLSHREHKHLRIQGNT